MKKPLAKDINYLILDNIQQPIAVLKKGMNQDIRLRYMIEQHYGMTIISMDHNSQLKQYNAVLRDDSTQHLYSYSIDYKPINIF